MARIDQKSIYIDQVTFNDCKDAAHILNINIKELVIIAIHEYFDKHNLKPKIKKLRELRNDQK